MRQDDGRNTTAVGVASFYCNLLFCNKIVNARQTKNTFFANSIRERKAKRKSSILSRPRHRRSAIFFVLSFAYRLAFLGRTRQYIISELNNIFYKKLPGYRKMEKNYQTYYFHCVSFENTETGMRAPRATFYQ